MLNDHPDLLKATKFVGQSQGKQENDKGFNQKEQKKVSSLPIILVWPIADHSKTINDFKEGKHNILVSTSIGEEGLDIGEVDFVIIYDMPKQSIKLVSPHISQQHFQADEEASKNRTYRP
jgi:ATP-dependent DNA helicase MPH1